MRLSSLLWCVAFIALGLGAVFLPADVSGIVGLTLLGHLLTALALGIDLRRRRKRGPTDAAFLAGVLAGFAAIELFGLIVARREGEAGQAAWFAAALGFAAAGMLAAWRGGGSDGAIAAQLGFHGVLIVPAIAAAIALFSHAGGASIVRELGVAGPIARWLTIVSSVAFPPLFAMLMMVLPYDLAHRTERSSPVWPVLVAHESAYVVLAARWAFDGI